MPTIQVKGVPWDIKSLLGGTDYASAFTGGVWCHSFLCTYNYYRQHAPVSGTVVEAKVIQGGAYLAIHVISLEVPVEVTCADTVYGKRSPPHWHGTG
jgi:phosphatidylserine decarboxylase